MLVFRSTSSVLGRGFFIASSTRSLSQTVWPHLFEDQGAPPSTTQEYQLRQAKLTDRRRVPDEGDGFEALRTNTDLVFRDFTPFLAHMKVMEPTVSCASLLLRGRRWGKSVFGDAWLAFLRREERLFKGTAIEGLLRKEPLIGVKLELADCTTACDVVQRLAVQIEKGLERADVHKSWSNPLLQHPASLSHLELLSLLSQLLFSVDTISRSCGRKFALFVDDFDAPLTELLKRYSSHRSQGINAFMVNLLTKLKAHPAIPFQLLTGSSQLPSLGPWNGADLSWDPALAEVLGYTWPQIEQHFGTQLRWLQHLHKMEPDQLRSAMEKWYGRHRWSPVSSAEVFNPWGVHQLMATGEFGPHWALRGGSTPLLDSNQVKKTLITALLSGKDYPVDAGSIEWLDLSLRVPEGGLHGDLRAKSQHALLLAAGLLSAHPHQHHQSDQEKPRIDLVIPNLDARQAILLACDRDVGYRFERIDFDSLIQSENISELVEELELSTAVLSQPNAKVTADLISMAFTFSMLKANQTEVDFRPQSLVKRDGEGNLLHAFHVSHLQNKKRTVVVAFSMTESRRAGPVSQQAMKTLSESWQQFEPLVKPGNTGGFSVAVVYARGHGYIRTELVIGPMTAEQISKLLFASRSHLKKEPEEGQGQSPNAQEDQGKERQDRLEDEQLAQFDLKKWCESNSVPLFLRYHSPSEEW